MNRNVESYVNLSSKGQEVWRESSCGYPDGWSCEKLQGRRIRTDPSYLHFCLESGPCYLSGAMKTLHVWYFLVPSYRQVLLRRVDRKFAPIYVNGSSGVQW